ncbi:FAD synthase, partial [Candidatus Kuenenbacteria bacterium CG22_combo_CG10-13_8_21_14_all_39_9]
ARDVNVKKIKGHWPNQAEIARLKNLKNANLATEVMLGSIDIKNRCHIINKIKPDIIALGYDQKINMTELKAKLKKYKLNPAIIRLKPYHPEKYKSSLI